MAQPRGNPSGETRPGSVTVTVGYDGYGRLTSYAKTGTSTLTHAYNGLDDRVSTTTGTDTRRFVYDADGRLLGEYGTAVTDVKAETIWLAPEAANDNQPFGGDDGVSGYAPLAVATGGAIYWVHGNHLGVPIVTTDTGATASPSGFTRVGFPGQTQTLSDLYYNRYRDYDPNLGRYIQADPIGISGGENVYLYALANPLRWTDPRGLFPFLYSGVYCGPDYTGNRFESYNPKHKSEYLDPISPLDVGCKVHDICYYLCRTKHGRPCDADERKRCFRKCDDDLSSYARALGGLEAWVLAVVIGQHWGN